MKVKHGFVSNSSSCSFIIAYKNKDVLAKRMADLFNGSTFNVLKSDVILDAYINASGSNSIDTIEDLQQAFGYNVPRYDAEKALITKGFKLISGYMPDSGDGGSLLEQSLYLIESKIVEEDFIFLQPFNDGTLNML